jgi:catechol 2,3-dioxygenase-like lactoylglutathione lyase family enzyme
MSHVAFCVRDMEKSLAFYQEALGFRVLNGRMQDTTTGGLPHVYKHRRATRRQVTLAYGEGDARPQLVITEHPGEPPDGEPIKLDQIGISHLSFSVPSVAQLTQQLLAKGYKILTLPTPLRTRRAVSAPCFSSTPMASWFSSTRAVAGKSVCEKAAESDVRTHWLK